MLTVHQVSEFAGVSIRTLQYYDRIGLLPASEYTEAGYRLYDDSALERLQQILLFRELEFPLQEIKEIIDCPDFDREKALKQQIRLLELKKEHIEGLISLAQRIRNEEETTVSFKEFDKKKLEQYAKEAKESWGNTQEYKEFEARFEGRDETEKLDAGKGLMKLFEKFGNISSGDPCSDEAQALVKELQEYITEHFYKCTDQILASLGKMYVAGGEFTDNIDKAGGSGTAAFVAKAIEQHCNKA